MTSPEPVCRTKHVRRLLAFFAVALWLTGCQTLGLADVERALPRDVQDMLPSSLPPSGVEYEMVQGMEALAVGQPREASEHFNSGLKFDPQHPHLNFLNGFAYHLLARSGDLAGRELAEIGYRLSIQFDSNHWLAHFYLGVLQWELEHYVDAQQHFADALLIEPDRPVIAYALAAASYASGDLRTARGAIAQMAGKGSDRAALHRADAIINAAMGRAELADASVAAYGASSKVSARRKALLRKRVTAWLSVHDQIASPQVDESMQNDHSFQDQDAEPATMVVLDALIIERENTTTRRTGINLLSGLSLQFGGSLLDFARNKTKDLSAGTYSTNDLRRDHGITITLPAVTYTLNIVNAKDSATRIVAHPSVVAHEGIESELFVGQEVTYTTQGDNGSSFDKEIGLTLAALPEFLSPSRMRLAVRAELDAVVPTAAPGSFAQAIATAKSRTNVTADIAVGQTLVIAAGSSSRSSSTGDAVPGLRLVPGLKHLFETNNTSEQRTSLLVLITPRLPQPGERAQRGYGGVDLPAYGDEVSTAVTELHRRYPAHWPAPTETGPGRGRPLNSRHRAQFRASDIRLESFAHPALGGFDGRLSKSRFVIRELSALMYF